MPLSSQSLKPIHGPNEILSKAFENKERPSIYFDKSTGIVLAELGLGSGRGSGRKTQIADPDIAGKVCYISWRKKTKAADDTNSMSGRRRNRRQQRQEDMLLTVQGSAADSKFYVNKKLVKGKNKVIDLDHGDVIALGKNSSGKFVYQYEVVVANRGDKQQKNNSIKTPKSGKKRKKQSVHDDDNNRKKSRVDATIANSGGEGDANEPQH